MESRFISLEALIGEACKCRKMLTDIGINPPREISFQFNGRLSKALGRCCQLRNGGYRIEISTNFYSECIAKNAIKDLHTTILHELIHTLPKCFNHGETFHRYADKVNRKYDFDIDTKHFKSEVVDSMLLKSGNHAEIQCLGCGIVSVISKRTNAYKHLSMCSCKWCKGKLKVIGV